MSIDKDKVETASENVFNRFLIFQYEAQLFIYRYMPEIVHLFSKHMMGKSQNHISGYGSGTSDSVVGSINRAFPLILIMNCTTAMVGKFLRFVLVSAVFPKIKSRSQFKEQGFE